MGGSLNQYIVRISIFLLLILVLVVFLYPVLQTAFLSNIYINLFIVISLVFGLIFCIYHLSKLNEDYSTLANFNKNKSPQALLHSSALLKNLVNQLTEIDGRYSFK